MEEVAWLCIKEAVIYSELHTDRPIVGTARVIGEGFDTDRMMRSTVFEFDPPVDGRSTVTHYTITMGDDGFPMPTEDWMVREDRERFARRLGYELVG